MGAFFHHRRLRAVAFAAAVGLLASSACGSALFVCGGDDDCAGAGAAGVCEAQGWCSFPDESCASGRHFGELAGDGLAGTCVPSADDTSGPGTAGSGSTAPGTSASTTPSGSQSGTESNGTDDPTIASLEGGPSTSPGESSGNDTHAAACGDGFIDAGEACDDGNNNGAGGDCRADCQLNVCGDGDVGGAEECDGTPDCMKSCQLPECGNGQLDPREQCDVGVDPPARLLCSSIGYVSGNYTCDNCVLDLSECEGCGANGCQYGPCQADDDCDDGEQCSALANEFCSALCETDDDCAGDIAQVCLGLEGAPLCLPVCVDGVCPAGLDCFGQMMPPVCV